MSTPEKKTYQICARCVMDTSDSEIEFDDQGVCNHCREMEWRMRSVVRLDGNEARRTIEKIKRDAKEKKYDCVIGISGGVDSTYLAYLAKTVGLRPLAVHLDNGWDTELAANNIAQILNKLKIDLITHVLDWNSFRDLQVAFLKASTPDSEIPTDHAIAASLIRIAKQHGIKTILQGMNMRTEGIMPRSWSEGAYDWRYIRGIHKKYGTMPLKDYPHFSLRERICNYIFKRVRVIQLLNLVDYKKTEAIDTIQKELGWKNYPVKHGESIYTRFYQSYILPEKFGFDKRRGHLSALIVSGQIDRKEAMELLGKPPYPRELLNSDREYVLKKLKITSEEFEEIMKRPPLRYRNYANQDRILKKIASLIRLGRRLHILSPQSGL